MFAYCGNNPINCSDPSGEITIATLILIGSAILGAAAAAYTAFIEYLAGYDALHIIGDSLIAGFSTFMLFYSAGMTMYQCYQNYCYLKGITPVSEINLKGNVPTQLQNCANTANASVEGKGPVVGTQKHSQFAKEVNALGNSNLATEVSYKDGELVPYGTPGSIRFDVMQYDRSRNPIAAWDLKTGSATLSQARILRMQEASGLHIPIYEVR